MMTNYRFYVDGKKPRLGRCNRAAVVADWMKSAMPEFLGDPHAPHFNNAVWCHETERAFVVVTDNGTLLYWRFL